MYIHTDILIRVHTYTHTHTYICIYTYIYEGVSPVAQRVKCLPAMQKTWVWSLGREDPLQKETATHSSTLAWNIPLMEEPGRLQSTGSKRAIHNWATFLLIDIKSIYNIFYRYRHTLKVMWVQFQITVMKYLSKKVPSTF